MHPTYDILCARWRRMHALGHLQAIAEWDRAAMMPAKGNAARADALAEVDTLLHGLRTSADLADLLQRAGDEPLDDLQRANLAEMRREWRLANALPVALVEAQTRARAHCEHAWQAQRPANDWAGYATNLRPVVDHAREQARRLADVSGLAPHEALIDTFEPGMTHAELDRLFGDLLQWLPDLVRKARDKQAQETLIAPIGPFPKAAQRALNLDVMRLLGFDFDAGRLDESAHPFNGGVPEDTRMTTRYSEADFLTSMMATVHETGHARYEQNLPRELLGQPVARARSAGIHESQSLSFEMQLAQTPAFVRQLTALIIRHLGAQPAFTEENLYRLVTRVQPGFIRVDADECTYPLHVILRYGIERALIEGEIDVDDIPALWDARMREYLDIDTRGNYRNGCMQDVHWGAGLFGYFPSYALGAMYAAQWFTQIRRQQPALDARIAEGDLQPAFDWLAEHIWRQGSRWSTEALTRRASGEALNPQHYRRHLEARYL
jgi:carboxypeptidase Taq